MKKIFSVIAAMALSTAAMAQDVPAFPGAEGHGRYATTGGRGGKVYHVTNLNDSGTGSLRWALSQAGPRTIVFDVSGYIDLKSNLAITSNTTIAGQTAPGSGITLRYYTIELTKCDNVIIRFIRFRRSQVKNVNDGADATWGRYRKNIILDHCSFSWSIDEVASFYDNRNFTMQWCNVTEALANPGHSKGAHSYGGIWGGKEASFHHNFIAHVQNRAPRFNGARYEWKGYDQTRYPNAIQAEIVDFRNCVMYNWGNGNGCYGGPGGGYINMVNNYYKAGPGTKSKTRVTQVSVADNSNGGDTPHMGYASRYYINGNYVTAASTPENYDWKGVIYDNGLSTINGEKYIKDADHLYGEEQTYVKDADGVDCIRLRIDEPVATGDVTTHSAKEAFEKVLAYCGASLYRDEVDARLVEEAKTGTTTYTGAIAKTAGILDVINDPSAATVDEGTASYPELVNDIYKIIDDREITFTDTTSELVFAKCKQKLLDEMDSISKVRYNVRRNVLTSQLNEINKEIKDHFISFKSFLKSEKRRPAEAKINKSAQILLEWMKAVAPEAPHCSHTKLKRYVKVMSDDLLANPTIGEALVLLM